MKQTTHLSKVAAVAEKLGIVQKRIVNHSMAELYVIKEYRSDRVVVLKGSASTYESGQKKIEREIKQMRWLSKRHEGLYPEILSAQFGEACSYYTMPLYGHQTLDKFLPESNKIEFATLAEIYSSIYNRAKPVETLSMTSGRRVIRDIYIERATRRLSQSRKFSKRIDKVFGAKALSINGEKFPSARAMLNETLDFIDQHTIVGNFILAEAMHGDLVPTNILSMPSGKFMLLDVRGQVYWRDFPMWDPFYDLAKLGYYYYCWHPVTDHSIVLLESDLEHGTFRVGGEILDDGGWSDWNRYEQIIPGWLRNSGSTLFHLKLAQACHCLSNTQNRLQAGFEEYAILEYLLGVLLLKEILDGRH